MNFYNFSLTCSRIFEFFRSRYGVGVHAEDFKNNGGIEENRLSGYAPRRQYPTNTYKPQPEESVGEIEPPMLLISGLGESAVKDFIRLHESGNLAQKTPVSILQEFLVRHAVAPRYELMNVEGALHRLIFKYHVSCEINEAPFTAMGTGGSKNESKQSAARALIRKLTGVELSESQTNCFLEEGTNCSFREEVTDNPVGSLQELCTSRGWPIPTYESEQELGLPHERIFTFACNVLNFREMGQGKSKKMAKRCAANEMLRRLQEYPQEQADDLPIEIDDVPTCSATSSRNCTLEQLETIPEEIECKCWVQLGSHPAILCLGFGITEDDAEIDAAQNAIEHLKTKTLE